MGAATVKAVGGLTPDMARMYYGIYRGPEVVEDPTIYGAFREVE